MSEHAPSQTACTAGPTRSRRRGPVPLPFDWHACHGQSQESGTSTPSTGTHGHHPQLRCSASRLGLVHHQPGRTRQAPRAPAQARDRRPTQRRWNSGAPQGQVISNEIGGSTHALGDPFLAPDQGSSPKKASRAELAVNHDPSTRIDDDAAEPPPGCVSIFKRENRPASGRCVSA